MGEMSGNRDEQLSEIYDRLQELKNDLAEIVDNEFDEEQETEKTEALYDALEMLDDTRKAERFFKERNIKYQFIDLKEKGMSKGELTSVLQALVGIEAVIDPDTKDRDAYDLIRYLAEDQKFDALLEHPLVLKQPIVRNGKQATAGYEPDVWKSWS